MSTSNIPIKSPFGVREADENNRKEERLRDYPIEVEGDSVFYTVEFHYDTEDRGKDSDFVRGIPHRKNVVKRPFSHAQTGLRGVEK